MNLATVADGILKIGVEPAIIAALLYIGWEKDKVIAQLTAGLGANTLGLQRVLDYVMGGRHE